MATHVLSGISATTYLSSTSSNDAALKETIVTMTGYDCKVDDVSVHLVNDVTIVPTTLAAIRILYSITTPTQIFNDTNVATAMFIKALNESIVTRAFDTLLHVNTVGTNESDWQSVTTDYVIFSTAAPTSSPSSSPTSSPTSMPTSIPTSTPTRTDLAVANLLTIPLDGNAAKAKIQYYLGAFLGYFLFIYICLYLYSFLRYGNDTATRLYDSSYQSQLYITHSVVTKESGSHVLILSDLYSRNELVQSTIRLDDALKQVKQASIKNVNLDSIHLLPEGGKYSKGYREYMHQQRTVLGCSPLLYPNGFVMTAPCVSGRINLPPGKMENIILFLCHNHPLFSCFYFMEGSKLGAHGTRILYIGKDVVVFVLYQFSNMLLQYLSLDGIGLGVFINLFVITPSAVSIGLLLKYLYTCPFTETVEFQRRYAKHQAVVFILGRVAIVPIVLVMSGSLIIACIFSSSRNLPMILIKYFLNVQFYGFLHSLAKAIMMFVDSYYYKLSLFGTLLDIVCIGELYKERIIADQLVDNTDYVYRVHDYLFGLLKVQQILNRADAIKARWITENTEGCGIDEMNGGEDGSDNQSITQSPSQTTTTRRDTLSFGIDSIYGGSNDEVCSNSDYRTENPIHSGADLADCR